MKVKELGKIAVAKTKVHGKGTINLPKGILEVAGIQPNNEVLLYAKNGEIQIKRIKTPEELMGILPASGEVTAEFPYSFRGAFADALDFFEALRKGLPFGKDWETGFIYGKVYLKPKGVDLRTSIHLSYFELPNYPNGAITIDGGIKQFLTSPQEVALVDQNLSSIEKTLQQLTLNLRPFGDNGFLLIEGPEFGIDEASLLASLLTALTFST